MFLVVIDEAPAPAAPAAAWVPARGVSRGRLRPRVRPSREVASGPRHVVRVRPATVVTAQAAGIGAASMARRCHAPYKSLFLHLSPRQGATRDEVGEVFFSGSWHVAGARGVQIGR